MRLILEWFEPDVFQRKAAENRRAVEPLIARRIDADFGGQLAALGFRQLLEFFRAEGDRIDLAQLESSRVVDLRAMSRRIPGFPIKGRDVARAGREELLAAFRSLNA